MRRGLTLIELLVLIAIIAVLIALLLHGMDRDVTGTTTRATGADLMRSYTIRIPERHRSDLIVYRNVRD